MLRLKMGEENEMDTADMTVFGPEDLPKEAGRLAGGGIRQSLMVEEEEYKTVLQIPKVEDAAAAGSGGGKQFLTTRLCLSFSGAGFLGTYHFGSIACFLRHGKWVLNRTNKYAGASAGSIAASVLLLCPELVDCIMASCFIPIYAGYRHELPVINGAQHIDGGLSENLPRLKDIATITVSPFSGEALISPYDPKRMKVFDWTMTYGGQRMKANVKNLMRGAQALFPPKQPALENYRDMGFRDTMKFLIREGLFERENGTAV